MKVYIGADHRGYELKEKIFQWLVDHEYDVEDFGAYEYKKGDDYTEFSEKVASVVASHHTKASRDKKDVFGILLCGSGVGVEVVANKFDGVRAAIGKDNAQVRAGRSDDDMNVLVIASDFTSEEEAKDMVETFLNTDFSGKDRYKRRLEEIENIENNN
jgi:ribose 5-phosphate isomerase B